MPSKELLYTRPLRRPLDGTTRQAINDVFTRRRHEIPLPTELQWHPSQPQFTIRSSLLSFVVRFSPEAMRVDAELSLAARMLVTPTRRREAIRFIDGLATDIGL